MPFAVDREERGLYYLISVHGEFTVKALAQLRNVVEAALEASHIYIAFDLSKTTFMDSSGMGLLSNLNQKLIPRGGSLFLISPSTALRALLQPTGILQAIPCLNSLEEADSQIG